ncbi:TolC family protein [Asticcacaulis taihuensis]|uniref:TolC family protein n=1 Tax=Asticcacaulis taihuensis TaxID=260084 RepID=UPI003F7C5618
MSFPNRKALRALFFGASLIALVPVIAAADPAPSYSVLLRQANAAPRLKAAQAGISQAEGLARQARARLNPTLSLESENFAGNGPYRGFAAAEITASVEQTLELGGKRGARVNAGRAGIELSRARARQTEADFAFDLAEAYGSAEVADLRVQLATDALSLAQDDARVATALVKAGKEADLRSLQAQTAVETARAELGEAQATRDAAFARLTAMVNSPVAFTTIPNGLLAHADRTDSVPAVDPLTTPAYLVALAEREEVAHRVKIEQTRATPDVTVSLGVRQFRADDSQALVGGVSVPFPVFDRNTGNIAAASAELSAAEQNLNIARLDAQADIQSASARLHASFARVKSAQGSERTAQEAYRLTRIGYESGKLPLSELLIARRTLTEARTQALTARQDRLNAEAELTHLAGTTPFGDL